ncbi:hypothetical protein EHM69_10075 [candidate division KSB1 bacterium]|nr:MAG: hypothetical protein EHM69_10075 [candidate division KSB1 bacterium]
MNYPVGPTEQDTISDIVPDLMEHGDPNHWELISHLFVGDRSVFTFRKLLAPGITPLNVRVLDYAAEGDLSAYETGNSSNEASDPQQIPPNYEQWKRDDDNDGDGFTYWEEYRGFIVGQNHLRTHTYTNATVFIDNVDGAMPPEAFSAFATSSGYLALDMSLAPFETYSDEREFLDFKSNKFCAGNWDDNPLCDAGYDPLGGISQADQIKVLVNISDGTPASDYGVTTFAHSAFWGLADVQVVNIYRWQHIDDVSSWQQQEESPLPPEDAERVYDQYIIRTFVHELGHTISIPDHSPLYYGSFWCPMKYVNFMDYPPQGPPDGDHTWERWIWGTGYCSAPPQNCQAYKHIRP